MNTKVLTTFGLSASAVNETLADFSRRYPQLHIKTQAAFPEMHLHLRTGESIESDVEDAVEWMRRQLGAHLLSAEGKSLEAVVGDLLRELGASVAVAESCTGGLISHLLTNVSGSSDYFLLAAVTYSNAAKQKLLGVSKQTLQSCGAVHENTAAEMASGIQRISGADYGLATTGIAGPTGGSRQKPVGTLCVGLAGPQGVESKLYSFTFAQRLMNKQIFAATALDLLRKRLLKRVTEPDPGCGPCAG